MRATNRGLLKDCSVSDLMTMRERGMSNAEIAKALDVSRATIYRYIGAPTKRKKAESTIPDPPRPEESRPEGTRKERNPISVPAQTEIKAHGLHGGGTRPVPDRVILEYNVADGVRVIVENGKVTITGAERMDPATARKLCRTIMLLGLEEKW